MQHDLILIGTGKLASNLIDRLAGNASLQLFLYGRNKEAVNLILEKHSRLKSIELNEIPQKSVCVLCVSDSAISLLAQELKAKDCFLIHCAGAVSIDVLIANGRDAAVIWPLQSFTELPVHWNEIPLIVERRELSDSSSIHWLLESLGGPVHYLNSERRQHLHLAAVMVNNFSNYLFTIAQEYCIREELPFETLKPLIKETVARIGNSSMKEFQTGPAIRGDFETIEKHLELLNNDASAKSLYEFMSNAINKSL